MRSKTKKGQHLFQVHGPGIRGFQTVQKNCLFINDFIVNNRKQPARTVQAQYQTEGLWHTIL